MAGEDPVKSKVWLAEGADPGGGSQGARPTHLGEGGCDVAGLPQGRSLRVSQLLTFSSMSEKQHKAPPLSLSPASKLLG